MSVTVPKMQEGSNVAAASAPAAAEQPSVLILTKDEEINIADCLRSLIPLSDDIVVLDSYSTDRTVELAESFPNVRVVRRKFDTWSRHSNWALDNIDFRHAWVYYSDADERVTPDLRDEILSKINDRSLPFSAYRLRYKNIFLGRWIRFGGVYPVWIIRLFRPEKIRYEDREVNAHPVVDGQTGELREHFIHYSFNKGLVPWFHKHNSYSEMEAHEANRIREGSFWGQVRASLFAPDRSARRRALKNLSFYPPGRDVARFVYTYLVKMGLLNGRAGFHYAAMISMYEYWIELKIQEQRHAWQRETDRKVTRLLSESGRAADDGGSGAMVTADGVPLIDVLIPTLNEAEHIADAVANARQVGPVFVLDSHSTDGTRELARAAGATVVERTFVDYAEHKNWGIDNLPFKGEWVFILDADERITPQLHDQIRKALTQRKEIDGWFINRVLIFMGRQIRHGGLYPSWNLRLFRRGKARYEERSVHEHMVCQGPTEYLPGEMLHIRRESLARFLNKHIKYADMESDEWVKWKLGQSTMGRPGSLFKNVLRVRQWVRRHVWPRLPARPMWRFFYMYLLKMGFLDGTAGWHLARLMSCYEYMIGLLYRDKLVRIAAARERAGEAR